VTEPDLPSVPGKAQGVGRDYEYVRHGTVSILAGIDLHSGHVFAAIEDRHRSIELIGLLARLDAYYPPEAGIRVVLDNHSAHISRETRAWLATRPGRFEYVHTPKHGSWLNLIECAFSKMARPSLRHIRVDSVDELKPRIPAGRRGVQRRARRVPLEQVRPRPGLMCKHPPGTKHLVADDVAAGEDRARLVEGDSQVLGLALLGHGHAARSCNLLFVRGLLRTTSDDLELAGETGVDGTSSAVQVAVASSATRSWARSRTFGTCKAGHRSLRCRRRKRDSG
jgi:transposase